MALSVTSVLAADASARPPAAAAAAAGRLAGLDLHRGLIMAAMAIDHASVFIARTHTQEFWGSPLPLLHDAAWFWARWMSHLCAPGFALLMGVGMALLANARTAAGWSEGQVRRFFVKRGLLLIALQFFVEDPAWIFGIFTTTPGAAVSHGEVPGGGSDVRIYVGVLFSLGACMVLWGVLVRARAWLVAAIGAAALLATEWLTPGAGQVATLYAPWMRLLLVPGHTNAWEVFYPVVPWIGVVAFGLLLGRAVVQDAARAQRIAGALAVTLALLFVVLRLGGGFGNLHEVPPGVLGFFTVVKYPPSLAFLAITLAVNLALMANWSRLQGLAARRWQPFTAFGRSAMMFYLAHLWLFALLGLGFRGGSSLAQMLTMWITGLAILWPLCLRYDVFKRRTAPDSIWRFF